MKIAIANCQCTNWKLEIGNIYERRMTNDEFPNDESNPKS